MRFTATIETFGDGSCLGWVHELPGCAARARHRTEIERAVAAGIRRFLAETGEAVPERIELAINSESEVPGPGPEATAALIETDRVPLDEVALARMAHVLALSRESFLERLAGAEGTGGVSGLRDEALHVGLTELFLAAQTFDTATDEGLRAFLGWTRSVTLARLGEAAATDAGAVSGESPSAERWTASKVARRLVWHERLHLPRD